MHDVEGHKLREVRGAVAMHDVEGHKLREVRGAALCWRFRQHYVFYIVYVYVMDVLTISNMLPAWQDSRQIINYNF